MIRRLLLVALLAWIALGTCEHAFAGGGPERVLVVANEDSPLSLQVAKHYMDRRGIHPTHLCRLGEIPSEGVVSMEVFKTRILGPIKAYIAEHGLEDTIDIVTYSVDFPFGVNYGATFKDLEKLNKPPIASITGLTYLHAMVEADDAKLLGIQRPPNAYVRFTGSGVKAPHGYRRAYRWGEGASPQIGDDAEGAGGYFLCTMLGWAGTQGNTTAEILACIDRGVASDGTSPKGTVYLMDNPNVRSTTRTPFFDATHRLLEDLAPGSKTLKKGEGGEDGLSPKDAQDIIGLVAGTAKFTWPKASRFLPGAIAEHLTSFGARLDGSGQTKCTEYIRQGATGTSGTVAEPYALWPKFPLPFMHAHYAAGCNLAEAFYQNVASPYQLLILGDPLAAPYAKKPVVVAVPAHPGKLSVAPGTLALNVTVKNEAESGGEDYTFEMYVDGVLFEPDAPDKPLVLDTSELAPGNHTARVVAIRGDAIETRGSAVVPFVIAPEGAANLLQLRDEKRGEVTYGEAWLLKGKAKGLKTIEVFDGHASLGTAKVRTSGSYRVEIDTRRLGPGMHTLTLRGTDRAGTVWESHTTHDVLVLPPERVAKGKPPRRRSGRRKPKDADLEPGPGLVAEVETKDGKTHHVVVKHLGKQGKNTVLKTLKAKVKDEIVGVRLSGEWVIEESGEYRVTLGVQGDVRLLVNHTEVVSGEGVTMDTPIHALVRLEEGTYPLVVEVKGSGALDVRWGGATVQRVLGGASLVR